MTKRPEDFRIPPTPEMRAVAAVAHAVYGINWMRPLSLSSGVPYTTLARSFSEGMQLQKRHLSTIHATLRDEAGRVVRNGFRAAKGVDAIIGLKAFEDVCEQPEDPPVVEREKQPRGRQLKAD